MSRYLLTPIASDLHLTEGEAGQAISVSGLFAVLTSLSITTVKGKAVEWMEKVSDEQYRK